MINLKLIITFLITSFLLTNCTKDNNLKPKKTIITGEIVNLDKHSKNRYIQFCVPDLFSQNYPLEAIEINKEGLFRYEVELVSPALCYGLYNQYFPFVISPGDSLYFSIDTNLLSLPKYSPLSVGKEYIKIGGTVKDDYEKIINFDMWACDSIYTHSYHHEQRKAIKLKSPEEYKVFLCNRENEALKHIERFGHKQKAGKLYYKLLKAKFQYRKFNDIIRYWWLNPLENGKEPREVELPQNFFALLSDYDMKNKDFFDQHKVDLIQELKNFLMFKNLEERETYLDICKKGDKANIPDSYFKNQTNYICEYTQGITRDLCLHFSALSYLGMVPSKSKEIYASVSGLIEDTYVLKNFKKHFKSKLSDLNSKPEKISKDKYTALDSLISKNNGKVIYVDFWAPWCGPCMREMKPSKKLKKHFKGKDVVFVYLGCRCKEKSWKYAIADNNIEGINHLLSKEDLAILTKRYDIPGIPHFLLINKKGEVVSNNTLRPSQEITKTEISKLLDE